MSALERVQTAETIASWLDALVDAYGDRPCVEIDGRDVTYRELHDESTSCAAGLLAREVGKGTRVGVLFGNSPSWVVWWAALSRIGAVCVPLSTFLQPAELARVIRHADVHGLVGERRFLGRDFAESLADALPSVVAFEGAPLALPEAPFLRWIALDDATAQPWCRDHAWIRDAGAGSAWEALRAAASAEVHPEDDAIVIYTSGQSAEPKGVVHSHRSVMTKTHYLRGMYDFGPETVTTITLPFFWVGGLTMGLLPTLDAGGVVSCTERSTWGSGQVIGGSADQDNLYADFRLFPALGMTESFGIYSWGTEWRADGHPIASPIDELQPDTELRLVDEFDAPVGDGEVGEILLRGPTITRRLHKVDRAESFDADSFYRTGDRGLRDGDRIHFVGRLNDMIKTSGANVSPAEVERELLAIDGVAAAYVVAVADPVRDQAVGAALVLEDGVTMTADDVRERLRTRLSVYKVPRLVLFLDSVDDVPMTPSMKVRKRELAAMLAEGESR